MKLGRNSKIGRFPIDSLFAVLSKISVSYLNFWCRSKLYWINFSKKSISVSGGYFAKITNWKCPMPKNSYLFEKVKLLESSLKIHHPNVIIFPAFLLDSQMELSKKETNFIDLCFCSGIHAKAEDLWKMSLLDFIFFKVFLI